ncbi:TetR family transcriptional regulator [Kribbella sp. DT2]|uniref:TetR/AcrR family transcriptional regulator n=1 Tax=Kribbella sp. DT2 TaxID=3393427 RepID=UPI003CF638C9
MRAKDEGRTEGRAEGEGRDRGEAQGPGERRDRGKGPSPGERRDRGKGQSPGEGQGRGESEAQGRTQGRSLTEQARRAQIVAAAIEVIARDGASHASFKVIAQEAGLSSTGLISYHFASKQELVEEVGQEILTVFGEFVLARTEGIEEPAAVLRGFVEANVEFLRTHRRHASTLVRIKQELAPAALARSDQAQLAEVLRQGQQSGVMRDFDPHLVAVYVLSIRDGLIRQLDLEPDLDLTAAAEEFRTLVDLATRKA